MREERKIDRNERLSFLWPISAIHFNKFFVVWKGLYYIAHVVIESRHHVAPNANIDLLMSRRVLYMPQTIYHGEPVTPAALARGLFNHLFAIVRIA